MRSRVKPVRRASVEELLWIQGRLMSALETKDIIFSVQKLLKERVLLHVLHERNMYAVYLNFRTGRFSTPKELEQDKKPPLD